MASDSSSWRSPEDATFLDNVTARDLKSFRDSIFPKQFITSNPTVFLDSEWVDVTKLKAFLVLRLDLAQKSTELYSSSIKTEKSDADSILGIKIKDEPRDQDPSAQLSAGNYMVKTRRLKEHGREVLEILSDSDVDEELDRDDLGSMVGGNTSGGESEPYPASLPPLSDGEGMASDSYVDEEDEPEREFDPADFVEPSDTNWNDAEITSTVIIQETKITSSVTVQQIEYLTKIPSLWPIPRIATAFVLDLCDEKFKIFDKHGKLITPDALIKNKDQDSWTGGTGSADTTARVVFSPGSAPITCRRSRLKCRGCHVCSEVDPDLIDVPRHELDPGPRDKIFAAQRKTRQQDGNSVEKRTITFFNVIESHPLCEARDNCGKQCEGRPMMKEKPERSRGHGYFIACGGWTPTFQKNHRTMTIPDYVDEHVLAKLMAGKPLSEDLDMDTAPCSCVVPPHIGMKLKHCPHPHIVNGKSQSRSQIIHRGCPAQRTIYVPLDTNLRMALVVHREKIPHNHPMPPMSKVSLEAKATYRGCVEATSTVGATVQKVDNAPSTKLLLGGKSPGQYDPALQDKRVKRTILRDVKLGKHPAGLGLPGAIHIHMEDVKKPMDKRYVHKIIMADDGGILIFTFVPYLLGLIHEEEVTAFECDVTFKRVLDLNEWEMVTYLPSIQRTITLARVYTNKSTTEQFVRLFDELQRLTELHSGKRIRFKRFSPEGNLLVMNADMEAAQILAAGISFLRTNDPEYSKIYTTIPEEFVQYFVRVCLTHGKRAVLDFKLLVSAQDFQRLINFPYLKSREELDTFTLFVKNLKIKKIEDWWNHKIRSDWIIPCILQSQSRILPEHWAITPATTNMGEAQHHWTNKQSGIKLPLVEAILSAQEIDEHVAEEIKATHNTGILVNKQSELFHRVSRNSQRHSASARKARDADALQTISSDLREKIEEEKAKRKESTQRQRDLQEELSMANGKGSKKDKQAAPSDRFSQADANSSGRVKSVLPPKRLRNNNPNIQVLPPAAPSSATAFPESSTTALVSDETSTNEPMYDPIMTSSWGELPDSSLQAMQMLPDHFDSQNHPYSGHEQISLTTPIENFPVPDTPFDGSLTAMLNSNIPSCYDDSDFNFSGFGFTDFDFTNFDSTYDPLIYMGLSASDPPVPPSGVDGSVAGAHASSSASYPTDLFGFPVLFLPAPLNSSPHQSPSPASDEPMVAEDDYKKRQRDEVDVRDILPEGSKRVKIRSSRAREMDM